MSQKPIWWWLPLTVLILVILMMEFLWDTTQMPLLSQILWFIDVGFIGIFIVYLLLKAARSSLSWFLFLKIETLDIFILVSVFWAIRYPRFAAFLVMLRFLSVFFSAGLDTPLGKRMLNQINLKPSQTLTLSFLTLILFSTLLLMSPAATKDGLGTPFLDALFTATSAACVVGLVVVDTGSYFSYFGQGVVLLTIQLGGIGIMVLSAAFAVLLGSKLATKQQKGLAELLDAQSAQDLRSIIYAIMSGTLLIESLGALFLFLSWGQSFESTGERIWWSLFHSISAFCNAGFGLHKDNLIPFAHNTPVCFIIAMLIVLGGLGFAVLANLADKEVWVIKNPKAIWSRLELQTKVVLSMTLALNLMGMLIYLFLEFNYTLSHLSVWDKIMAAFFQPVSMRTAGFQSVDLAYLSAPTILFSVVWMFIGGSPGSTAGGIKTTTAAVAFTAFKAMLEGRNEAELFGRRLSPVVVNRSLSIIFISAFFIILILMCLVGTQTLSFESLLFETVSAFGTVGLSMGVTAQLDEVGKSLIIILMYLGRVGPLTFALAVGARVQSSLYRYPKGQIAVG